MSYVCPSHKTVCMGSDVLPCGACKVLGIGGWPLQQLGRGLGRISYSHLCVRHTFFGIVKMMCTFLKFWFRFSPTQLLAILCSEICVRHTFSRSERVRRATTHIFFPSKRNKKKRNKFSEEEEKRRGMKPLPAAHCRVASARRPR